MPRAIRRFSVLSGLALCAVLVGPVAVAQASDNTLRLTLNSYGTKIANDSRAVKNGFKAYPQGHWRVLTRALKGEVSDLRALKTKLAQERASTARGAKAKREMVRGLSLIVNAFTTLRRDIFAVHGGTVPAAQFNTAKATDAKGRKKFKAGFDLLR